MSNVVERSFNNTLQSTSAQYSTENALKIRLLTKDLIEDIEMYLKGEVVDVIKENDQYITRRAKVGARKANDKGVQSILAMISAVVNPHVVQGNFPSDGNAQCSMYDSYIYEININLVRALLNNCYSWEIADEDIEFICDFIMSLIIPFMTRLIDNKEREGYNANLRSNETHTVQSEPQRNAFKMF